MSKENGNLGCFGWIVILAVAAALYLFRADWLPEMGADWVVNEPLVKSDVIAVLGGGVETRPFAAAKLYHDGWAPKIVVMNPKPTPSNLLGLNPTDAELTRQILLKEGVPQSAFVVLINEVTSTHEESMAFRRWAATNAVKSVIIPTDPFHTRRVRWVFRKELKGAGIRVTVEAVPVQEYDVQNWWRNEHGAVAFQNELFKFMYYELKY